MRLEKNLLPQEEKYCYTQNGELLKNTFNMTGKENLERLKSFRVSQNDYHNFENISHGQTLKRNEQSQPIDIEDNNMDELCVEVIINL